jgi:ketosteroid isomerase-like protein
MGSENMRAMEAIIDAVNRRAFDEMLEHTAPDFEIDFSGSASPDAKGMYRGHEEARGFLETIVEPWEEYDWFATEFIEDGDQIVRVGGFRAKAKAGGPEVTAHGAQLWGFRDGRAIWMRQFDHKDDALEAAGIAQ